jgi:stage V sporulation protein SpoVS
MNGVARSVLKCDDLSPGGLPEARGVEAADNEERLISLRADVLADAEHALGNLLQRMHHLTRVAPVGLGPYTERFNDNLQNIERLLELVFDYISPPSLGLRAVPCGRVAESLAVQLRAQTRIDISVGGAPAVNVLVDARALGRGFQLIIRSIEGALQKAESVSLDVFQVADEGVELRIELRTCEVPARSAENRLAWAVGERLVELHGGEIVLRGSSPDCMICSITLPSSEEVYGAA